MKQLYEIILKHPSIPFHEKLFTPINYFLKIYKKYMFDIFNNHFYNIFKFNRKLNICFTVDNYSYYFDDEDICEEFCRIGDLEGIIKIWNSFRTYKKYRFIPYLCDISIQYNHYHIFKYFIKYNQVFNNSVLENIIVLNRFKMLKYIGALHDILHVFNYNELSHALQKSRSHVHTKITKYILEELLKM